ncbi:MAG TPA: PaaI family thioesterase [Roseomonas sp.]|jgi:uncharacterized protein (TIGR00369 family)
MPPDGLEQLRALLSGERPAVPFAEATGIRLTEVEHGRVVFTGTPSRRFYNPHGTVHGGWIAGLLDSAMGCAVHSALQPGQGYTTIDMTTGYVRAVLEESGTLRCEGQLVTMGRRIARAEGKVFDAEGRLVAHGSETCLILERSPA